MTTTVIPIMPDGELGGYITVELEHKSPVHQPATTFILWSKMGAPTRGTISLASEPYRLVKLQMVLALYLVNTNYINTFQNTQIDGLPGFQG